MAHKVMTKEQLELLAQLEDSCKRVKEKAESTHTGYVVAGYAGEVQYCYCGEGKGYEGAPLRPACLWAVVFEDRKEAVRTARRLAGYSNGKGDEIRLGVVVAWHYFKELYEEQKRCVEMATRIIDDANNKNK